MAGLCEFLKRITLTDIILLLTLAAIVWYTLETYKLRLATVESTRLTCQPLVCLFQEGPNNDLFISNIGNGHAVNIALQVITPNSEEMPTDSAAKVNMLVANDKRRFKELFPTEYEPANNFAKLLEANADPRVSNKQFTIDILYSDVLANKFKSTFEKIESDGLLFKTFSRLSK